tara:strand:- start:9917 stop:11299 length:1383 start_codon:yes stop_codon:yes gene_type:complete
MTNDFDIIIPHNFVARDYQLPFLREVQKSIEGKSDKRFFYQIWHRRSGKDKSNIADVVPRRLIRDPVQVKYVYPTSVMGRGHMWEAIDRDGFRFLDHIPEKIRTGDLNDTRMLARVQNGTDTSSLFQVVGANRPDALRGGNPKLFVFSEWAEHDPYAFDVIEPILRENDGIAIFNTTPKGDNHARALLEFAKDSPLWWTQTLTVDDTSVFDSVQMEQIKKDTIRRFEAAGRSKEEALAYIEQEYYCSFDSPVIGSYYGANMKKAEDDGRVTTVPYDNTIPVNTAWDLGMDDSMTIWFFQVVGLEIRFIDYYENSGEGLAHYALELQDRKYIYGKHYAPHDVKVRELGTGKSRHDVAKKLGINFIVAPKLLVDDGINMVRSMFNQFWFDKDKCNRGVQALKNYKKEWNEVNMVYRKIPLHNWASHGADGLRTFATGYKKPPKPQDPGNVGGIKPYFPGMPG